MANESLGQLTAQLGADLGEMRRAMDRAEKMVKDYERTTDRQLDKAESRWQRYGRKVSATAGSLKQRIFGLQGAMAALGGGLVIYKALDAFSELDQGLIEVRKTANLTNEQVGTLRKEIQDLALEVPVATEGLLEIAGAAGQLGVKGVKDIVLFTETMGKMQIASDVVGAEGAKSLARLLNTAGEGTDKVDELASVIVRLGNNMAASEREIIHMASEIGRGAAAFEMASEDAAAFGAAAKALGGRAESSGSAITRAMIEIQKAIAFATEEGGKKLQLFQDITRQTGEQFKTSFEEDAAEALMTVLRGIKRMDEEGTPSILLLEQLGMSGIEAVKGLTPLIKNLDILENALRMANEEVKNATALDKEAIRATESFAAQMRLAWNAVDQIAAGIGKGLAPAIVDVVGEFREWVEENQEFLNQQLPKEIDDIASSIGDMATAIGGFVNSKEFGLIMEYWELMAAAAIGFKVGGPWGALGGLAVGSIYKGTESGGGGGVITKQEFARIQELQDEWDAVNRKIELYEKYMEGPGKLTPLPSDRLKEYKIRLKEIEEDAAQLQKEIVQRNEEEKQSVDITKEHIKQIKKLDSNLKHIEPLSQVLYPKTEKPDDLPGPAYFRITSELREQRKQLQMTGDEWEVYQAVQRLGIDATKKQKNEIRAQVRALQDLRDLQQDMRELQQDAARWDEQGRMAPAGIGPGYSEQELEESRRRMGDLQEDTKEGFNAMEDFSRRTATSMQQNFSDLFFDGMMNQLDDLEAYWKSFGRSVYRILSDIMAKQLVVQMVGKNMQMGESSWIGMAWSGITDLFSKKAAGGPVSPSQSYIVGERGPEIFSPNTSGQITPNDKISTAPNVQVNVIDNTSEKKEVSQDEPKFDGEKWVMNIVLDAANRNKGGFAKGMKASLAKA